MKWLWPVIVMIEVVKVATANRDNCDDNDGQMTALMMCIFSHGAAEAEAALHSNHNGHKALGQENEEEDGGG